MDKYKTSRAMYILEAAFEYFISMLTVGAFLAKVTKQLGLSDGLIGILTAFVSLGCSFQILAVFISKKRSVKKTVTVGHIINQLLFTAIYILPVIKLSSHSKTLLFILCLLGGHVISNIIFAPKTNWLMSLIPDGKRGSFTALKEIVSLMGGMLFSLIMGKVIDIYEEQGNIKGAFIICAATVFTLTVLHTFTLLLTKETPFDKNGAGFKDIPFVFKNKKLRYVIGVNILWNISYYISTPFYGTYQITELGFSLTFVSVLSVIYSITRSIVSKPIGKYADRHCFADMLCICFTIAASAFLINTFTTQSNGKILFTLFYILLSVAMAGINSGCVNIILDYAPPEIRTSAIATASSLSGVAGFLTTALASTAVSHIQDCGNTLLGIPVYAQQLLSLMSCILIILLVIYTKRHLC